MAPPKKPENHVRKAAAITTVKLELTSTSPPSAKIANSNVAQDPDPLDFDPLVPPPHSRGIDEILAAARLNLSRLDPHFAFYILSEPRTPPAVLVDIRPVHQRHEEGVIPGALPIDRNVLEWRFDPRSAARLSIANRYDLRVIVFCSEGYTSSLAARSLQELGLWNATDIVGGFKAWKAAGLGRIPEHAQ